MRLPMNEDPVDENGDPAFALRGYGGQGVSHPLTKRASLVGLAFLTERAGFEPAVRYDPYTGLANRRIQPLCHLS